MAKKPKTEEVRVSMLTQFREALGDGYLANRPSFKRAHARCLRRAGLTLTREDYEALMLDIRTLDELLADSKVDTSQFSVSSYVVNSWAGNRQTKATLKPVAPAGQFDSLQPATPTKIKVKTIRAVEFGVDCVVVPDIHFGFVVINGRVEPIHDERAVALVLEVIRRTQPKVVIQLGDLIDFASFGSFPTPPSLRLQTQPALETAYGFWEAVATQSPGSDKEQIEGNHTARIQKSLAVSANEVLTITRPGDAHPVMSLQHLLRLDELGVRYHGPYGASFWRDKVSYTHGELIGAGGGLSVAKVLKANQSYSTFFGHTHRAEFACRSGANADGEQGTVFAMNCGTLARLDGIAVPGSPRNPDWQNAFGLMREGGVPQLVMIRNGECFLDGKTISASSL